jgi:hypothetical protein
MAAGSIVGSFIDSRLPGMIPYAVLLPILAFNLAHSAINVWRHRWPRGA